MKSSTRYLLSVLLLLSLAATGCVGQQKDVQLFIDDYTGSYRKLVYEASVAEWASNTRIMEGDDTNARKTRQANEKLAEFTGSTDVIEKCGTFLEHRDRLSPLQVQQLESILYMAADKPQTVPDLVKERIAAETEQVELLFGFTFKIDGKEVSTNDIDEILNTETDLDRRLAAWRASKEVGPGLRNGLKKLQHLRNQTVRALGYSDFFAYQVSDYGMTTQEMLDLTGRFNQELRPLYRELHTYWRYELARKYGVDVPDLIPAHWLPNRWGQDWAALVEVKGLDLDGALKKKSAEWLVKQAEDFYVSLGFDPLPASFYSESSLYPLPENAKFKKNNHASAWHLDLDRDVRSLMSVEPNARWYETTHHELGHIYYYISYTNPDVPVLLRGGADRAYHEAIGSLMGLAAMQPRFASAIGLDVGDEKPDPIEALMNEALNYVVFIPWSAGVMTQFEYELYARELPDTEWNKRWWEMKARFQGIAPPETRGNETCDPPTKTHINNDAAQYYDYALSYILLMQFHDYISRNILEEDPHDTNYFGRKDVGKFLAGILSKGATVNGRALLRETIGEDISAEPMLRYFGPLMEWLKEKNQGRKHTLPSLGL